MKKVTSFLVVLAVFMSASCGSLFKDEEEDATSTDPLVGTWTATDEEGSMTVTFNNDGTYSVPDDDCNETGTWSTTGSEFTLTPTAINGTDDECSTVGESDTISYDMASDGKSLTISGEDEGGTWTMTFTKQ